MPTALEQAAVVYLLLAAGMFVIGLLALPPHMPLLPRLGALLAIAILGPLPIWLAVNFGTGM